MPRVSRKRSKTNIYHVMIRGNGGKNIFLDEEDKRQYIDSLINRNKDNKYLIYAYCLMDNHVHLLINECDDNISSIMKSINVRYVYYFNKKYHRKGHLFQDRFKSEVIEDERYLLAAIRYIHNNPVKAGIAERISEYKWSSYNLYISDKDLYKKKLIERDFILKMFSTNISEAKKLFVKFSSLEDDDEFIEYENKEIKELDIKNEKEARLYINNFLDKWNLNDKTIKKRKNIKYRIKLIKELKKKSNLSIRQIASILNINRNIVQRAK